MQSEPPLPALDPARVRVTALVRYSNHATPLAALLESLRQQTRQPDVLLGINNQSTDGSTELMLKAGGRLVDWTSAYQPARVLNFGMSHCETELVFMVSAHVRLVSADALARLVAAVCEPGVACASNYFQLGALGETIRWRDLEEHGIPYSSIHSNACGILRRSCWAGRRFNEGAGVLDDYEWAVAQLRRGHACRRVGFEFLYHRPGPIRYFLFTRHVRALAHCQGLRFTEASWLWAAGKVGAGIYHAIACPSRWKFAYDVSHQGASVIAGRLTWWPLVRRIRAGVTAAENPKAGY